MGARLAPGRERHRAEHLLAVNINHAPVLPTTRVESGVHCGDAVDLLPGLATNSVDAVITDPPYGLDKNGDMLGQVNDNYHRRETHGRGYADNDPDAYLDWCRRWIVECERVLKPGGFFLSFAGARTVDLVGYAARQADLVIRDQLTWVRRGSASRGLKQVLPDGRVLSTTTCPAHEPIVCAQKRPDSAFAVNLDRWGTGFINVSASSRWSESPGRWPTTVFDYPKAGREERHLLPGISHPTVKPLALARELVRLYAPTGGKILDPFAGSGTTVEAAIMESRNYVAFEREAVYLPLIGARVTRARAWIGSAGRHETSCA